VENQFIVIQSYNAVVLSVERGNHLKLNNKYMKVSKINIEIKEKYFLAWYTNEKEKQEQKNLLDRFLLNNAGKIEIIESKEITEVNTDGKKKEQNNYYSGYYVKYYIGSMEISGSNVAMKLNLSKKIIDLALKEAGGEIKELVKQEYQEFEKNLYQLIDKTEKKNIFGNFVVSKLKKLKEAILNNSNK
jgi:hypothetical protein